MVEGIKSRKKILERFPKKQYFGSDSLRNEDKNTIRDNKSGQGISYAEVVKGVVKDNSTNGTVDKDRVEVMKWDEDFPDGSWLQCCACPGSIKVVTRRRAFSVSVWEDLAPINPVWISWRLGIEDRFVFDSSFPRTDLNNDRQWGDEGYRSALVNVFVLKKGGDITFKSPTNPNSDNLAKVDQTKRAYVSGVDLGHNGKECDVLLKRPIVANKDPKSVKFKDDSVSHISETQFQQLDIEDEDLLRGAGRERSKILSKKKAKQCRFGKSQQLKSSKVSNPRLQKLEKNGSGRLGVTSLKRRWNLEEEV
ncbi:hypothetical protein LWI29_010021 [Acer saccharum]|uniref:Uncharacterized protein n=1 Tax=Acer saccharum TaxID=4024 RepID=A0AA39VHX3_ACESA|nr:hypothetical protein LWI29_010021 [Acer saccharum]